MEEVQNLLRAKIQCIWIDTYEEYEVIKDLKEIANNLQGMKLFSWSHTEGLKKIALSNREIQEAADRRVSVEGIFQTIGGAQDNQEIKDESIFMVKDFHLLNDTHQVKRLLRDIKERPSRNYNPIVVVSPIINIPIEHEKLFTVIKYNTPTKEEISNQVQIVIKNINTAINAGKDYTAPTAKETKQIIDAFSGLTYNEITDVLAKSVIKYRTLSLNAVMEEKIQLVEKSGVLDYKVPEARFEDIGGNELFKEWVLEIEDAMSDEAKSFGCSSPKGYLALGVPGTAKTYLAEALANKWGIPLLQLNMSKIMNKLVGESEKKIDQAFRIAEACAPCIFLIDEVEKALSGTRSSNSSDAGTTSRVFSRVLQFLNDDTGVFTIMTSNDVSQLPPELTRTGRLDAKWYFSLPSPEERKEIFEIHTRKTNKEVSSKAIDAAVKETNFYTGAEIKEIVKVAMRKAYKRFKEDGINCISEEDLVSAAKEVIPIYESSKEQISYLESWVNGRARYTGKRSTDEGYITNGDNNLLSDILRLEDIR
jgi:ATP-dependent 26S proteasome regulatory subunit